MININWKHCINLLVLDLIDQHCLTAVRLSRCFWGDYYHHETFLAFLCLVRLRFCLNPITFGFNTGCLMCNSESSTRVAQLGWIYFHLDVQHNNLTRVVGSSFSTSSMFCTLCIGFEMSSRIIFYPTNMQAGLEMASGIHQVTHQLCLCIKT